MMKNKQNKHGSTSMLPIPAGLSQKSIDLWNKIVPSRALSPGRLAIVEEALKELDEADRCRDIISTEGVTKMSETTGAVHAHPLCRIEAEHRKLFVKLWTTLGLFWDAQVDGR